MTESEIRAEARAMLEVGNTDGLLYLQVLLLQSIAMLIYRNNPAAIFGPVEYK